MTAYIVRRLFSTIVVMAVVAFVVFSLLYLTPGDPAAVIAGDIATYEDIRLIHARLGLDEPFLVQFGLESVAHLPGLDELKAAGFLEALPPSGMDMPSPSDELGPDEDPYIEGEDELATGGGEADLP